MGKFIDLTGQKINKWIVLCRDVQEENNRLRKNGIPTDTFWICQCECGTIKSLYGCHLRQNRTQSCRKCSESKHKHRLNSRIWGRIRYNAKCRNLEFNLDKQFLYDLLYIKQKCKCALSGLDINIANTIKEDQHGVTTASLDRIDSKKGYIYDNVQWVHKDINFMKQEFNQEYFIEVCKKISQYVNTIGSTNHTD